MPDPHSLEREKLLSDLSSSFAPGPGGGIEAPPAPPPIPDHELVRCIGRGSYGEVWLARSVMGPWRAVKLVYRRSFDHERPFERELEGIRRFEPVSRSHPSQLNILHVGRSEAAGCFYYVMELADPVVAAPGPEAAAGVAEAGEAGGSASGPEAQGWKVIEASRYQPRTIRSELYRRGRLPFDECLQIGLALATALDHLHRHGLVHRDIKPSNIIFVNGIPKLADIGLVAAAEATLSLVGTEGYLPPEGPGTPQADIFSLGKVLYEMATGRDRQDFPELPTNFLELSAEERGRLAELNEIIVRAAHADPRERYRTAAEVHADLALLQTGRSVSRMRNVERRLRWVQRAGAVVTVMAALAAGLYVWQKRQTDRMRELAEAKSRLAAENGRLALENRQVAQVLKEMLAGVQPAVAMGRDTALLRELLETTANRLGTDFKGQPEVEAELRTTLGSVYRELGEYERSETMLREALRLRREAGTETPAVADALVELASTLQAFLNRAEAETWHRLLSPAHAARLEEAEQLIHESLALRRKLVGAEHPDIAATLGQLSTLTYDRGQLGEAETLAREALAMARKFLPEDHTEVIGRKSDLAIVLGDRGGFEEAEALYRETLEAERRLYGENHPRVAGTLTSLGGLMERQERLAEAESCHRQAIAVERRLGRGEHPHALGRSLNTLGLVLERQGRPAEAEAVFREALPYKVKLYGDEHLEVAAVQDNLAGVVAAQGRLAEAETLHQQALKMRQKLVGEVHPHVAVSCMALGNLRQRQGRLAEAEAFFRQGLAIEQQLDRPERPYVPELAGSSRTVPFLNRLASNLQRQGRVTEAEAVLRQALGYLQQPTPWGAPPETATLGLVQHHLAEVYCALQKCAEARDLAAAAVGLYARHPQWSSGERNHAYRVYLSVLLNLGENAQAERVYAEAIAAERRSGGGDGVVLAQYLGDLATLLQVSARPAEAEEAFREGLQALREHSERVAQGELAAMILHHLADLLRERRALPEARLLAEEGYSLFRRNPDWPPAERQHAGFVLKEILVAQGDLEAAATVCRQRVEDLQAEGRPDSPELAGLLSELTLVLLADQKFPEAEAAARPSLRIREKQIPDDWRTFNSRSLLGGALLGQQKHAEAEPLLRSGYEGMKEREAKIPPQGKPRLKEALQRLVQLCEETGRPEKAQEWRREMAGRE